MLSSDRLLIKQVDESFANAVLQFYSNNKVTFEPWEPAKPLNFYTLNYQRSLLTAEQNLTSQGQAIRYFLFEKTKPDKIIGSINFHHILRAPNNSCKLGYKLAATATHQGYAYEAISFLIPNIMEQFQLQRMEADIMPSNLDSIKLIEKLHFYNEGICRRSCEINGLREDHIRYSLLKSD